MITANKRLTGIMLLATVLLLIPLIAMQFTQEVNWTLGDFVAAGALLFGTGFLYELVMRTVTKWEYRIALCVALLFALFLLWAELAVGIVGTPLAGS